MRMRKKKNMEERMDKASRLLVRDPQIYQGKWNSYFNNHNPIHLEIGSGKGNFIINMAQKYPNINFIGIEKYENALLIALEKTIDLSINNLTFIAFDARNLKDIFSKDEISQIYLNFSDPWSKARYYKRRLTYKDFLDIYKSLLLPNGEIHLKTDNVDLFAFSLKNFLENGFVLSEQCNDLHNSEYNKENIVTEYEADFTLQGLPINRVVAKIISK